MAALDTITLNIDAETFPAREDGSEPPIEVYPPEPVSRRTDFAAPGELFFSMRLRKYFNSRGTEQKNLRRILASTISRSTRQENRIYQVLHAVVERRSQETMAAAIDLLSLITPGVVSLATKCVFGEYAIQDANTAFVLAAAAGRADPNIIASTLLRSSSEPMREAAVELLADILPERAKPVLRRVAEHDRSQYIRDVAGELLADLD